MLADRRYCYPLTLTDSASRYLLCCEALQSTQEELAFPAFERAFKEFGLPGAIRSDNGVPFASRSTFFGLSKLSVWWLRLGIGIERIKPAHPQPPGKNFLQQQAKFDQFIRIYNQERPHQAIDMRYPSELYKPSPRPYMGSQSWSTPSTT